MAARKDIKLEKSRSKEKAAILKELKSLSSDDRIQVSQKSK
jgi:hypothetical protein